MLENSSEAFIQAVMHGDVNAVIMRLNQFDGTQERLKFVNSKLADGNTLLHIASRGAIGHDRNLVRTNSSKQIDAINQQHANIIKLLINAGADIHAKNAWLETPLIVALEHSRSVIVIDALLKNKASLNDLNKENQSLLHVAAAGQINTLKIIQLLISYGFKNFNRQDIYGFYPVHYLAGKKHFEGQKESLELLIEEGAKISCQNDALETPLHMAIAQENGGNLYKLIEIIIKSAKKQSKSPQEFRSSINKRNANGDTALHVAVRLARDYQNDKSCFEDRLIIVELLLFYDANLFAMNNQNQTPFSFTQGCKTLFNMLAKHIDTHKKEGTDKEFTPAELNKKIINIMKLGHYFPLIFQKVRRDSNLIAFKEDYRRLFLRYIMVSNCLFDKKYPLPPAIDSDDLFKDILDAKRVIFSFQTNALHDIPRNSCENHAFFMATVFTLANEFCTMPRIYHELRQIIEKDKSLLKEAMNQIEKRQVEYQKNNQVKIYRDDFLHVLDEINTMLNDAFLKAHFEKVKPGYVNYILAQVRNFTDSIQKLTSNQSIDDMMRQQKNIFDQIYTELKQQKFYLGADERLVKRMRYLLQNNSNVSNEEKIFIEQHINILEAAAYSGDDKEKSRFFLHKKRDELELVDPLNQPIIEENTVVIISRLTALLMDPDVRASISQDHNGAVLETLNEKIQAAIHSIIDISTPPETRAKNIKFLQNNLEWLTENYTQVNVEIMNTNYSSNLSNAVMDANEKRNGYHIDLDALLDEEYEVKEDGNDTDPPEYNRRKIIFEHLQKYSHSDAAPNPTSESWKKPSSDGKSPERHMAEQFSFGNNSSSNPPITPSAAREDHQEEVYETTPSLFS